MLVFLFYSILLFSQVKYINYSSIFSFQSFSLHILPSKVPISQQGFKTRCSPQGDNMGCTHRKTIVCSFPSSVWARSKANWGGSPLQYYLRAQTLDSERQSGTARSRCLSTMIIVLLLCVEGTREARVELFVLWLLLLFISLPLDKCIRSRERLIEKKTGEEICNQLYAPCNAGGSFKRTSKCDIPRGAVAHFETLWITLLGSSLNYVCAVQCRAL